MNLPLSFIGPHTSSAKQSAQTPLIWIPLRGKGTTLLVAQDALTLEYRKEIIDFTLRNKLPSMFVTKEWVEEGGLLSYGDRPTDRYRRAAEIVEKVLRGTKPSDIPVEQPTTFELAVNLKTAKAIGLTLSPAFLARVDLVIE